MKSGDARHVAFSVLMPVYRRDDPAALHAAMDSVFHQTCMPYEVVLVQDGSLTLKLDKVIAEFVRQYGSVLKPVTLPENVGLPAALNAGMKECSCEWIARMDSDDIAVPYRFERQFEFLQKYPEVDVLSAYIEEYDETMTKMTGVRKVPLLHEEIVKFAAWRNPLNHMAVVYRKSVVIQAGGYPEDLTSFEDYGLWMKLLKNGCRFANIPESLILARTGEGFLVRRSGIKYFFDELRLLLFGLRIGFYSLSQYVLLVISRPVLRLFPQSFLRNIYFKLRVH